MKCIFGRGVTVRVKAMEIMTVLTVMVVKIVKSVTAAHRGCVIGQSSFSYLANKVTICRFVFFGTQ